MIPSIIPKSYDSENLKMSYKNNVTPKFLKAKIVYHMTKTFLNLKHDAQRNIISFIKNYLYCVLKWEHWWVCSGIRLIGHFTNRMTNCMQHLLHQIMCFLPAIKTIKIYNYDVSQHFTTSNTTNNYLRHKKNNNNKNPVDKRTNSLTSNPLFSWST